MHAAADQICARPDSAASTPGRPPSTAVCMRTTRWCTCGENWNSNTIPSTAAAATASMPRPPIKPPSRAQQHQGIGNPRRACTRHHHDRAARQPDQRPGQASARGRGEQQERRQAGQGLAEFQVARPQQTTEAVHRRHFLRGAQAMVADRPFQLVHRPEQRAGARDRLQQGIHSPDAGDDRQAGEGTAAAHRIGHGDRAQPHEGR